MKTQRRSHPGLLASLVVCLLALAGAGSALAATYGGETRQDRKVTLRTNGDAPRVFAIDFRAPCRRSSEVLRADTEIRGLKGGAGGFRGKARYREELRRGFTARIRASVSGRRGSARRWTGRFSVRALLVKRGEVRDKCLLEGLPWRVSRR